MVRLHQGLRAAGVESRIHSYQPTNKLAHAVTLKRRRPSLLEKARNRIMGDSAKNWRKRIRQASSNNATYEIFTPPVAVSPVHLDVTQRDVDLVHLHWFGGFVDFRDYLSKVEVPVVWTLHDQNPYLGGFHYQGDVDAATGMLELEHECRDIKRDSLQGLNLAVAANSDWNRDLATTTGVLPEDTLVERLYLPLPVDAYKPYPKAIAKAKLDIDPKRFTVGFACASLANRRKGFADLIDALNRLPDSIRKHTTLISFGREPSDASRSATTVPWRHLGPLSGETEQSIAYSAMDVFVIPSLEEAFGQTPLESLACRTPVVGTRVGGIPETVIHGQTGLLSSPCCPDEIAGGIEQFYGDANLRAFCGDNGRQLAERRHATDVAVAEHMALYRRVLDRHSHPVAVRDAADRFAA